MLTWGDDYPLHQSAEPIAFSGSDRNFYDRYFFNGYSADGKIFFAAALGVYPQLDIMDAAFCLTIEGKQHNIRASKHMGAERLDLEIGPIRLIVETPLQKLRLIISENDSPITADLCFTARHAPLQEPRFTWRKGPRTIMDYTRMTQNGAWTGSIFFEGQDLAITAEEFWGTRDRSWGVRPVGAPDLQAPPGGLISQFYWLWMPFNFADAASFFHSNEDSQGLAWNRRGVIDDLGVNDQDAADFDDARQSLSFSAGSRRVEDVSVDFGDGRHKLFATPSTLLFYMSGLGYGHPQWGHGRDNGPLALAYDTIDLSNIPSNDMLYLHVQAFTHATLQKGDVTLAGRGVIEQMFIGPHEPSGFTGLLDPAP